MGGGSIWICKLWIDVVGVVKHRSMVVVGGYETEVEIGGGCGGHKSKVVSIGGG